MTITDRLGNVPEGLGIKTPCRAAPTTNITLSGLQTVDGVVLVANDRVLVHHQTDQTTNGIYQASTGNWTRPNDANNNESFISGTQVLVTTGTTHGGDVFSVTTTDDPIIIGTSLLNFAPLPPTIGSGAVIYSNIQNVTAQRLLGNPTSSSVAPSEISLGATLAFSGTAVQTLAMTGDVVTTSNSFATTISAKAVTYAKIQNVAASRILGNPSATVSASASEITLGATFLFSGSALQTASATGDVTWASNSFATTITNSAVTYAKMQFVTASRLLGNASGSAASPGEISLGATFAFVANALQTLSGTGDVTWASNSFATTIANAAVTLAKMSSLAASSFIANNTGSAATPLAVSASNAAAMLSSQVQTLTASLSNPTGTTSTGFVMMGFGSTAKLTPTFGTKVEITFYGAITNTTTSGGGEVVLRYGTGTAPSNQSGLTGSSVGAAIPGSGAIAGQFLPYSLPNIVTGLTPGTQYWFDLALVALTGGTASIVNNGVTIREF